MKTKLIVSLVALGAVSIGAASADTQWRYPYKSAPYAVPHTHNTKAMSHGTTTAHPHHRVPTKAIHSQPAKG